MANKVEDKVIFLVEDNPDDEALALRALQKNKIANTVVVARDGAEALDYLFCTGPHTGRDPKSMPTVIFLDLKIPKINGLEVLRRIREDPRTTSIPVVALTSSSEDRDVVECYQYHVNSYIRKPVDFVQFVEAVRQVGLYWLVLNHPMPLAA